MPASLNGSASRGKGETLIARGQAKKADQELAAQRQARGQFQGYAAQERQPILSGYTKMLTSPGYDQTTRNAMTAGTLEPLNAAFDTASAQAGERVARTRNDAGYTAGLDELARDRGRQLATSGNQLQKEFGDEAIRQREVGLRGLSGLYGIDTETLARLFGLAPGTLGARAAGGGWTQGFKDVAGTLLPHG